MLAKASMAIATGSLALNRFECHYPTQLSDSPTSDELVETKKKSKRASWLRVWEH